VDEIHRRIQDQAKQEEEEEQRRAIREARIAGCLERARELVRDAQHDKAMGEIEKVYAMDPGNAEARELEAQVISVQKNSRAAAELTAERTRQNEAWKREEERREQETHEGREELRRESSTMYRGMLKHAWVDGQPTREERAMLEVVRNTLGIPETEHLLAEREIQLEVYAEALQSARRAGLIAGNDEAALENLRQLYGITPEEHAVIQEGLQREMEGSS
jgi:tetratricopeptide (TPR) repeat protein